MRFTSILLYPILAYSAFAEATEKTVDVFSKSVNSASTVSLGQIKYDTATNNTEYVAISDLPSHESICLGTRHIPNRECFTFLQTKESSPKGRFVLFLNKDREIEDIAFHAGDEEWSTELVDVLLAPSPTLKPFVRQKQKQKAEPVKQKVIRKKTVEIDGKQTEIEEEVEEEVQEDAKLWLQKNWMWVVIPLALFMVMAPEEEKKEE